MPYFTFSAALLLLVLANVVAECRRDRIRWWKILFLGFLGLVIYARSILSLRLLAAFLIVRQNSSRGGCSKRQRVRRFYPFSLTASQCRIRNRHCIGTGRNCRRFNLSRRNSPSRTWRTAFRNRDTDSRRYSAYRIRPIRTFHGSKRKSAPGKTGTDPGSYFSYTLIESQHLRTPSVSDGAEWRH